MAKKIRTYVVADGCIQEGSVVFTKGDLYTPPTAVLEKELLDAGVIAEPAEQEGGARALSDAETKALADAEAKAPVIPTPLVALDDTQDPAPAAEAGVGDSPVEANADLLNQGQ